MFLNVVFVLMYLWGHNLFTKLLEGRARTFKCQGSTVERDLAVVVHKRNRTERSELDEVRVLPSPNVAPAHFEANPVLALHVNGNGDDLVLELRIPITVSGT